MSAQHSSRSEARRAEVRMNAEHSSRNESLLEFRSHGVWQGSCGEVRWLEFHAKPPIKEGAVTRPSSSKNGT
jgi:hypothetical protein